MLVEESEGGSTVGVLTPQEVVLRRTLAQTRYGSFHKMAVLSIGPTYHNPYFRGSENGTSNFWKPPIGFRDQ